MPHNRFFSPLPLNGPGTLPLSSEEARHLKVMRCKPGSEVDLIDGQGSLALATVVDREHLQIVSVQKFPKPKPFIQLLIAIPHSSHLDWMVEKMTELGVGTMTFFPGKLSVAKTIKLERVNRIALAATKQSGRLYLPTIEIIPKLIKPMKPAYFGSLDKNDDYLTAAEGDTVFIIGPEKGFHPIELQLFKDWGIPGKRLNNNILRAETACVAASAILLTRAH